MKNFETQVLIEKLHQKEDLSSKETTFLWTEIFSGKVDENDLEKTLMFFAQKGETVEEIASAAAVMQKFSLPVLPSLLNPKTGKKETIETFDVCGTGGSGAAKTFNLSTTVSFVMAAAGICTAKHGNRKASSQSGSADLLEALEIEIKDTPEQMQKNLEEKNMSFLFAQVLHPAMKYVMPVRTKLGIRTIFNFMGPLTNPSNPTRQLVGVSKKELLVPMANILKKLGKKSAMVVVGEDGLDEITLTGTTFYASFSEKNPTITTGEITPEEFGFSRAAHRQIKGGSPEQNAEIILDIFSTNKESAKKDIVLLNAGAAFYIAGKTDSIKEGITLARHTIDSGKALQKLNAFRKNTGKKI